MDAKYYRYGIQRNRQHLPHTADVAKQIVYGEYIQGKKTHDDGTKYENDQIYNAFIMPFDKKMATEPYEFVSVGTAEWKEYDTNSPNYHYVLGILMDTRYLMKQHFFRNESLVKKLSELIDGALLKAKTMPP